MQNRGFLAAVLFLGIAVTPAAGAIVEQIVAQVNSDIVTLTQLNREKDSLFQALRARYQGDELNKQFTELSKNVLPALIEELLLVQKAKDFGMAEDLDLEANAYLEDLMKRNNIPNLDALKQEMQRSGMEYINYYENLKREILVNRIKGAIVRQKIKIMKGDLDSYYQEHLLEFTIPEKVELAEIVVYKKDKKPEEVVRKINDVARELQAGQDFHALAKALSEGPTAAEGGNIGSFSLNTLSPAVAQAVAKLEPGQTSGIIDADFGSEIIRLVSRVQAQQRSLEDVRQEVEDKLFRTRLDPVMKDFLKELKQDAYIYVFPEFQQEYNPDSK